MPVAKRSVEIAFWANLLSKPQHQHRMAHFGKELLNRDSLSSLENENRSHPQRLGLPNRPKLKFVQGSQWTVRYGLVSKTPIRRFAVAELGVKCGPTSFGPRAGCPL